MALMLRAAAYAYIMHSGVPGTSDILYPGGALARAAGQPWCRHERACPAGCGRTINITRGSQISHLASAQPAVRSAGAIGRELRRGPIPRPWHPLAARPTSERWRRPATSMWGPCWSRHRRSWAWASCCRCARGRGAPVLEPLYCSNALSPLPQPAASLGEPGEPAIAAALPPRPCPALLAFLAPRGAQTTPLPRLRSRASACSRP